MQLRSEALVKEALEKAAAPMDPRPSDEVVSEVGARLTLSSVQAPHTEWENAYHGLFHVRRRISARGAGNLAFAGLCVLAYAACAVYVLAALSHGHLQWLPIYREKNWWFSGGVLMVAITLTVFSRLRRQPTAQAHIYARAILASAEDRYAVALQLEMEALISTVLNEHAVVDRAQLAVLDSAQAPSLVELDSSDVVPSASARDVLDFIKEHDTSAIGISGPRGVGKSTLMQYVSSHDPENYLGVYLPVPVQYSAADFFRVLFNEVATAVQTSYGLQDEDEHRARVRRSRVRSMRFLVGAAFFWGGILLIVYGRTTHHFPIKLVDIPGGLLAAAGVVAVVAAMRSRPSALVRDLGRPAYEVRERRLAENALRSLQFIATRQSTSKNTFAVKFLTMEDEEQVELSERELTHPELVAQFKKFVNAYARSSPRQIVIALDELDKMDDPQDALAFVNGVKDLLHIPGVHFLVSVSEDALHNFSLRGVPLRDAFDSSFDTITPIERFSIEESRDLLKRRVVDFPDPLVLLCHALSGGVPRDLIRAARQCVRVRRSADTAVPVAEVAASVLRQKAVGICEALTAKAKDTDATLMVASLRSSQAIAEAVGRDDLIAAVDQAAREIGAFGPTGNALAANAAAYLTCVSTLCAYFCVSQTNGQWESELTTGRSPKVVDTVARSIELLHFDSASAMAVLARLPLGLVTA
ncbi:P-loop NTPase fold protein [Actinacidiphila acidipaludis]|uniref:AAA family ATPase n=1 Tax=Actinacidiphila acidipaludis TaxID=2873382 RepID=A0ABS7QGM8_9ACTN|nr:P-loop NTPase fold protein [Streptomyces acidipaludis]MBY8882310.1 AAA family ATPase [Streptomyces acidipaludis]